MKLMETIQNLSTKDWLTLLAFPLLVALILWLSPRILKWISKCIRKTFAAIWRFIDDTYCDISWRISCWIQYWRMPPEDQKKYDEEIINLQDVLSSIGHKSGRMTRASKKDLDEWSKKHGISK